MPVASTTAVGATPWPVRLVRLARLGAHVLEGLAIAATFYRRLPEAQRDERKRAWSARLLALLCVQARTAPAAPTLPAGAVVVLNHVSWLDIFVLNSVFPATFLAKAEIGNWPVVGRLVTLVGTLYIERNRRAAVRGARESIAAALQSGRLIAFFPEGTTTDGASVERFHAALFQPAVDAGALVQPIALRYLDAAGRRTEAAGYVGEETLMDSVWKVACARSLTAELILCDPIPAAGESRHSLAAKSQAAIERALGVAGPGTAPGTAGRLPAASR